MSLNFIKDWTIINLTRTIKDDEILRWLKDNMCARLPPCFTFKFNKDEPIVIDHSVYGAWPHGENPGTITLLDFNSSDYPVSIDRPAAGLGFWEKPSIRYYEGDNGLEMGARIFHEMLHSMGSNSDGMDTLDRDAFIAWINDNGGKYMPARWYVVAKNWGKSGYHPGGDGHNYLLMAYYTFLISRDFPWCLQVVDNSSEPLYPPLLPTFFAALNEILKKIFKLK